MSELQNATAKTLSNLAQDILLDSENNNSLIGSEMICSRPKVERSIETAAYPTDTGCGSVLCFWGKDILAKLASRSDARLPRASSIHARKMQKEIKGLRGNCTLRLLRGLNAFWMGKRMLEQFHFDYSLRFP